MTDDDDKFPMHIGVERVTEHEDGSATYTFQMSDEAADNMQELGLKLILFCGVTQTDIQDVFDWILPPTPDLKTCVSCNNPSKGDFCEFCLEEE